ncbi:protein-methionine-sulfoxide reductase heme-binding subunit MsrQ [Nisaea sp.]|uniref:sulfite oxidase heme-binding subunit YedZ n=1 Tax=Nisaea sp. TaxID=2024842 RepID=UPI002B26CB49|nr:protein-methionine-sulfoxide reductase heme-binding subunit MsrQ [Nisaea sp.]
MSVVTGSPGLNHFLTAYLPWTSRTGRICPLRLSVFLALLAPALLLIFDSVTGTLGPRPWEAAIHRIGWWSVVFLLTSLAVTPLRRVLRWSGLIAVRRMIGVSVFLAVALHLLLYMGQQSWDLIKVASEIVLRFYLTIGFVALLGLAALAATSTDGMIRRLGGKRWQLLHKLVYPIGLLALVHFFLQSKNDVTEPILFSGLFVWLMLYRVWRWRLGDPRILGLVLLAVGAAILTGTGESVVISLKHNVPLSVMLQSQFDPELGIRPAWWVLGIGLAVTMFASIRQYQRRPASA